MDDEDIAVSSAHDFAANWRPIETAPKDGRLIITYGDGYVTEGYFDGSCWYSEGVGRLRALSHWMPLPDPPDDKNA